MAVETYHRERRQLGWWVRTLPDLALLALAAIGVYWDATLAIVVAALCVVLGGAYAITSGGKPENPEPGNSQAWAKRILSASIPAETAATSIEWLGRTAAAFLVIVQPPLPAITANLQFVGVAILITMVCAFALVASERRIARSALDTSE